MITYWVIELFLIGWILLIILLGQQLIKKYPTGQSYKQAEVKQLQSSFIAFISLIILGLIYFSTWLASWAKSLATSFSTDDQLADLGSTLLLTIVSIIVTFLFIQQKKQFYYYKELSGLTDILPTSSLTVLESLSLSKQRTIAQRLQWAITRVEQDAPIELTILFDKEELSVLEKILSAQSEPLDPRLVLISQQLSSLTSNNRPFRIIL